MPLSFTSQAGCSLNKNAHPGALRLFEIYHALLSAIFLFQLEEKKLLEHSDIVPNGVDFLISGPLVKPLFCLTWVCCKILLHRSLSSCCLLITSRAYICGAVLLHSHSGQKNVNGRAFSWPVYIIAYFRGGCVRCYCKRPLPAVSAYPSRPCILSNRSSTWKLVYDFVFRPGHSIVYDNWSSGYVPLATSSLTLS